MHSAHVRENMSEIQRIGESTRWSDIVIYRGEARWVEVADDATVDARGQIAQVLAQINETLERIRSRRTDLLQVLIFLADLNDSSILNELWDEWVPVGHPPVRACVEAKLSPGYFVEMVISAAVAD
jgi:enamine deaminase RidA (YjgF/YER057c/UK114 family)